MSFEGSCTIAIATLCDWLKNLAPVLSTNETRNQNQSQPCTRDFSRALSKSQITARNSDWFITLIVPVVIGRSNYFGIGSSTVCSCTDVILSMSLGENCPKELCVLSTSFPGLFSAEERVSRENPWELGWCTRNLDLNSRPFDH